MVLEQREAPAEEKGNVGALPAAELRKIGKKTFAPAAKSSVNSDDDDYDDDDDWRLEMSENTGIWAFDQKIIKGDNRLF